MSGLLVMNNISKNSNYIEINDNKDEISVREGQIIALKILKHIDSVCKKLNIQYWATFGTLIGAVRHQGFIPWDDDLDIAMKRDDYQKFIEYCINNKEDLFPYYIDHFTINKLCPFYIARFCDSRYKLTFDYAKDYTSGFFVDIYPYDGIGDDLDYWKSIWKRILFVKRLEGLSIGDRYKKSKNTRTCIVNYFISRIGKLKGRNYWLYKLDSIERKYKWEESSLVGIPVWTERPYQIEKEWFSKTIYLPFEDFQLPVPVGYDELLKVIYGDYMVLPSADKRVASHGYKAQRL